MIKSPRTADMGLVKNKIYLEFEQFRTLAKFKSILVQFDVDPQ